MPRSKRSVSPDHATTLRKRRGRITVRVSTHPVLLTGVHPVPGMTPWEMAKRALCLVYNANRVGKGKKDLYDQAMAIPGRWMDAQRTKE